MLGTTLVVLGAVLMVVAGAVWFWGDDPGPDGSGRAATTGDPAESPGPAPTTASGRRPVPGYGFGEVALVVIGPDGERRVLCVMEASTAAQRARGLMEVRDEELGGYDGMIFLFPVDNTGGFWMRNTPMPLSIAYLSADGTLVSSTDMEPCSEGSDCPSYAADGPYRMALEVPRGRLDDLGVVPGATVEVGGECPAREGAG